MRSLRLIPTRIYFDLYLDHQKLYKKETTSQDSWGHTESLSASFQESSDTDKLTQSENGENSGTSKDEGLDLIALHDDSIRLFDLGSSAGIPSTQNKHLKLPVPSQIIVLLHGDGYIVIFNIDDTMKIEYIKLTRPISPANIFQKVMIQLGISGFGEPPSKLHVHLCPLS